MLEPVLDVRPRDDRIVLPDLRRRSEGEMGEECGEEYLHLKEGEAPADAGVRAEGEGHNVRDTGLRSYERWLF